MSDIWKRLVEERTLTAPLRIDLEREFGSRGKKALAAIDAGKIQKYLDFFVVRGRTAEYVVDEDFCTCDDFLYRGKTCWHLLAMKIVMITGTYESIDSWYVDSIKP